jgi:hypothetical protein
MPVTVPQINSLRPFTPKVRDLGYVAFPVAPILVLNLAYYEKCPGYPNDRRNLSVYDPTVLGLYVNGRRVAVERCENGNVVQGIVEIGETPSFTSFTEANEQAVQLATQRALEQCS